MHVSVFKFLDWCVVIAVAIALSSVGFAHRTSSMVITPELAEYVASGGQLSDICGITDGEGTPSAFDCEACRITDNTVQTKTTCFAVRELVETHAFEFVAKRIAERSELDPARLTRAPPQA